MSFRSYVTPLGVMTGSRINSKLILPHNTSGTSRFYTTRTINSDRDSTRTWVHWSHSVSSSICPGKEPLGICGTGHRLFTDQVPFLSLPIKICQSRALGAIINAFRMVVFNCGDIMFIHCVPKNVTTLSRYNSDKHELILIIFGTNVTEKVGNQSTLFSHLT